MKNLNRQIIAVFNFLVTVGGAFAFGYKGVEVAVGGNMFAVVSCTLPSFSKETLLDVTTNYPEQYCHDLFSM